MLLSRRAFDRLSPDRCIVYGVVTEICVRHAVEGLKKHGISRVEIVTDAVRSLNQQQADQMLAGEVVTTTAAICS